MEDRVFYMVVELPLGIKKTESEACEWAKQCARLHPGEHFYVLKAIIRFEAIDRPVAETMLMEPR